MSPRAAAGALLTVILATAGSPARADEPKPPAPPAAGTPAAAPPPATPVTSAPQVQPHGAVVVAVGDAASPAARALAMDVYRDALLRPPMDEATARVLAGEANTATAPPRLKELADLRGTIGRAESDLVARRLLSSLGVELGVPLVVAVTLDGGRPVARALRVQGAAYERVELGATIETAPDGGKTFRWPGATATLRGFLGVAAAEPLRPVAPKAPEPPKPAAPRPFYKSPWFWGTAGVVAAAGITVLVLSRTTGGPGDIHLTGKVGP